MSVSYIVPVWREDTYARVALPWLQRQVDTYGAELIEVRGQKSIFAAQEYGRQQAQHRYIMYVHDDVSLIRPLNLTPQIVAAFQQFPALGLLGPVGKVQRARVPWWLNVGAYVGHYCRRGDRGQLIYVYANRMNGMGHRDVAGEPARDRRKQPWNKFAEAGLVDGFYLIEDRERMSAPWDTETYGPQWHGYDVDRCFQAHSLGLQVMVPPWLFLHDNAGHAGYKGTNPKPIRGRDTGNRDIKSVGDMLWLKDLDRVNVQVRQKWGVG